MKWIPVTERLPDEEKYYHTKGSNICCYWHNDVKKWDVIGVTHWLDESASLPSSSVTGESEAIGERKFTLKEALETWKACYDWHHDPESPDKKEYFKQTFGIDI